MTKEIYIYEKHYNSVRKVEAEERRERLSRIYKERIYDKIVVGIGVIEVMRRRGI